jgi:hypothetical protein
MEVVCQLHEAGWRLYVGCVCVYSVASEAGWRLSVCYMRQVDGWLQVVCVLCHLLETGWLLSARGCVLCQLHETVYGCLQGVCILSVT